MSKGIYGYWDNKKEYVAYIGKDSKINNPFNRNYYHNAPFNHNAQQINKALQNNPDRYDYFVLVEGDFPEDDLNKMESQAIELFKTCSETEDDIKRGDMNNDGVINAEDAGIIIEIFKTSK